MLFAILGDRIVASITVLFSTSQEPSFIQVCQTSAVMVLALSYWTIMHYFGIHTLYIFKNSFSEIKNSSPRNKTYQEYICIYLYVSEIG